MDREKLRNFLSILRTAANHATRKCKERLRQMNRSISSITGKMSLGAQLVRPRQTGRTSDGIDWSLYLFYRTHMHVPFIRIEESLSFSTDRR